MTQDLQLREKVELEGAAEQTKDLPVFVPAVDIYETEDKMTVVADMPGVTAEGLSVGLKDDVLTIRGEAAADPDGRTVRYREYNSGNYFRQFTISDAIDREKIAAKLKDGVLTLDLPKAEKVKPRQIEVKVE